jgi:hypothetical protein
VSCKVTLFEYSNKITNNDLLFNPKDCFKNFNSLKIAQKICKYHLGHKIDQGLQEINHIYSQ